jgi:glycosyltransferase involved in cell wall biosynthesis
MTTRVCMLVNHLEIGGLEKVVISLANGLGSDFEVSVLCLNSEGPLRRELNLPDSQVVSLRKHAGRSLRFLPVQLDLAALAGVRRFIRERHIDIVHAHNLGPLIYGGLGNALAIGNRARVVYSEHNGINSATDGQIKRLRYYIKLADAIVVVSENLQEVLKDRLGVTKRVRVIYNGIDGRRFTPVDSSGVRRELGIGADEFVFGTAVVLSKQKGITYLIEAARRVVAARPDVRFVVAGDGPLRGDLERQAAEAGLGNRLLVLGFRSDVPAVVSAFDSYVLPSLWEGLPLALIEALALGKPVVASSVGGNPEIVQDGVNGYLHPPGDVDALTAKLLAVAGNRDFVKAVRDRNQEKFRQSFSLRAMLDGHARLYEEVLTH